MPDIESLVNLPPVEQIGIVIRDVDAAIKVTVKP